MGVELAPVKPEHINELGRICYEAFEDICRRHGFPNDFLSPDYAATILGSIVQDEHTYAIAAFVNGRPAGSNFMRTPDEVGGIGPVSVDVRQQGRAIGRMIMDDALRYAHERGIERVRLMQDSFNLQSLALYASLGFDTKAPCAMMEPQPAEHPRVRAATPDDLPAVEALSRALYKVNRRNEIAGQIARAAYPPLVHERGGHITGYLVPGVVGHGAAESEDDMLALAQTAAAAMPDGLRRVLCPLREGGLYRKFLAAGFRNRKVMNLMAFGPYEEPEGAWVPSVTF